MSHGHFPPPVICEPMSDTVATHPVPAGQLDAYIEGYQYGALIYTAAKLGIADLVNSGTEDVASLAEKLNVAHSPLSRVMRALEAIGFCHAQADGRLVLDDLGSLLLDGPHTRKHKAILAVEQYWPVWSNLLYSVTTGDTAFEQAHGMNPWAYRKEHPEAGKCFNLWLSGETGRTAADITAVLDLDNIPTIADIAGGSGALISSILKANPKIYGILFEQEHVAEEARVLLAQATIDGRYTIVSGDIFNRIPVTADAYILKSVLHDWEDEKCCIILRNCRAAMPPGSTLYIIERLLPQESNDSATSLLDIHMLLVTGGVERTLDAYTALMDSAGLSLQQCTKTDSGFAIMQCVTV